MNHPNLQAIMDNITVELHFQAGKVTQEYIGTKTAIDAVYAGLLAEVIGEDVKHQYHSQQEDAIRNALKANQRNALKRWCYGDKEQ